MADKKISALTSATTPLAGTEVLPIVQGGATVKVTVDNLTAGKTVSMSNLTVSGVASFADGTAAAPSITNDGDTNTGIFFPAADTIAFAEGGVESMRIDSSGNVGIGTSSPQGAFGRSLHLYNDANTGTVASNTYLAVESVNRNAVIELSGSSIATNRVNFSDTLGTAVAGVGSGISDSNLFFATGGSTERMRIDSSGNVGIGTSSPTQKLQVAGNQLLANPGSAVFTYFDSTSNSIGRKSTGELALTVAAGSPTVFVNDTTESMRIDSSGNLLVGKTSTNFSDVGVLLSKTSNEFTVSGAKVMAINRRADDGVLIEFFQESTGEGNISVSGTTVSYNGGHLSRWAQTTAPKDDTLVKGTVLSNLDEMNVYTDADGNPVDNEQLNKVKVSDVEGDANVAGVFVNWTHDDQHDVDEINMAMTGDMIIRIAQGTTVARGDLLMSAGDGTAKPQGDDIVRAKTVAKVTSTHVTCTYADGSYCVPCVLMAC
jgi:hypothetical protein